jgi:hypothetical protein
MLVVMCLDGWFQDASTLWISRLVALFRALGTSSRGGVSLDYPQKEVYPIVR